ncbi:DNA sulfur modification protein DndB [Kribbella sp. NPDC050820]|uniref:DNA sulfur modification protein DndB n=1 Tax=Kribbella sp. NPDC050820 TaxID=3155408 RepID=UPI0033D1352A
MAITTRVGAISLGPNRLTTVIPISLLMDITISGMAFEPKEKQGDRFDHLTQRVQELAPARGTIQRTFFARAMKGVRGVDPQTGRTRTHREPIGWSPTRKYVNATKGLVDYIQGPFLDSPPLTATLPAFVLYSPEQLTGERNTSVDASMGGEYYVYELDTSRKFMLADGESRHLGIEISLSPTSKLSGSRREKLKQELVTVEIIHGIPVAAMGQMFADLNGKGVTLTRNEVDSLNIRDPWARAAKEIFAELRMPLVGSGRQVTAVAMAENKHLLVGQAITMTRALGLGSYSKATSTISYDDALKDDVQYAQVVKAGVEWFGTILDHFEMPTLDDGNRSGAIFTDPDRVLKSMPIKVALGVMGHDWVAPNHSRQEQHLASLRGINWNVNPDWQGIAGKVNPAKRKVKVDGKTVERRIPDEFVLVAASAKEIGANAVRALTDPDSPVGRRVRGLQDGTTARSDAV